MNIFKKIYCRTYQFILKIAIPFLPYHEPKLLDDYEALSQTLKQNDIKRILVVADKTLISLGLLDNLKNTLESGGFDIYIYDKTVANPTTDNVEEGVVFYNENHCQAIIAFGGGSIMDCAKAIGARIARPKKSLNQMQGILKVRKKIPLLTCIPTTAGTGSETTIASVITDSKTRHKYAINDFPLIPSFAILDAKLTVGLPPHITATTGMDALTHAIEAYIGNSLTKSTKKYALEAISLVFDNLFKVYENGRDLTARQKMLKASYLAGLAFTKSYVGYVHAIAHSLGGKYNVAHGEANAILLPFVLKKYGKKIHKKLKQICVYLGLCAPDTPKEEASEIFIRHIEKLNDLMSIPKYIEKLKKEDIEELAKTAEKEANPLYPVPVLYTAKDLQTIYLQVCKD